MKKKDCLDEFNESEWRVIKDKYDKKVDELIVEAFIKTVNKNDKQARR